MLLMENPGLTNPLLGAIPNPTSTTLLLQMIRISEISKMLFKGVATC